MAKADRLERLARQASDLEAEYQQILLTALQDCAAGRCGLLGHAQDRRSKANEPAAVAQLMELGIEIDGLRERLFMEPYDLHAQFLAARGPVPADAVGEPKQAKAWLARLGG